MSINCDQIAAAQAYMHNVIARGQFLIILPFEMKLISNTFYNCMYGTCQKKQRSCLCLTTRTRDSRARYSINKFKKKVSFIYIN